MTEITINQITGVLLAGGQSRRMFAGEQTGEAVARDKCLEDVGGQPMLAHVIKRFHQQVGALLLNANGDPARFAAFDLPVAADEFPGFAGPLAGVLTGMRWAIHHTPEASHIASVSTDAPFLPPDLVERLRTALAEAPSKIALASSNGHLHPVIGLWPVALADDLEAALTEGTRKVLHWTDRHGTVPVDFPLLQWHGRKLDPFFNANRPGELAEVRRLMAENGREQ